MNCVRHRTPQRVAALQIARVVGKTLLRVTLYGILVLIWQFGFAQAASSPAFVVEGPSVVADTCPTVSLIECVSVSYAKGSQIAETRIAAVPRGNLEFDIPVVSGTLLPSSCGQYIIFAASVTATGANAGETTTASANTIFDFAGGSAVLRLPVQVDWVESAVTFQISVTQTALVATPPIKAGAPPGEKCQTFKDVTSGPNLSNINVGSNFPFPFPISAFLLLVTPAAAFQLPLLPVAIVYGPLGNGSKAASSIQLTNIFGTNTQFNNSSGQTNSVTIDDKSQYTAGITIGFSPPSSSVTPNSVCSNSPSGATNVMVNCSVSIGVNASGDWDYSTQTSTQNTYQATYSIANTDEEQNTYYAYPAPGEPPVLAVGYPTQPFWQDIILAAGNAQYAAFDYPAGAVVAPLGSASVVELPIRQLDACKESTNVIEPSSMNRPGPWAANHAYAVGSAITDSNGNIEVASKSGTSSTSAPATWNTAPGGSTRDGTVVWVNDDYQFEIYRDSSTQTSTQLVWAQQWGANQPYPVGSVVYLYSTYDVVTTAGISGASIPSWNQQSGGTTSDGSVTWTTEPLQLWAPNQNYAVGSIVFDPSLDYQIATTAGLSGPTPPNWTTTTTTDGTVVWTDETPQTWAAAKSYGIGVLVQGSTPGIEVATTAGTSGTTGPAWANTEVAGSTTNDGTVVWTNESAHFGIYGGPANMPVWQWLSSDDCANIAGVDQFYVQKLQSVTPLAYRPIAPQQGINSPTGTTYTNSQGNQTTVGVMNTQTYMTNITSIVSNASGISGGLNLDLPILPGILNITIGANGSSTQTGTQTTGATTFNAQSLQSQMSITGQAQASTTVEDQTEPDMNIPLNIMQDLIYVGMAVQDTGMSPVPPMSPALRMAAAVSQANSSAPQVQGLPLVPFGKSAAMLRHKGMPSSYAVQTPYGYLRVDRAAVTPKAKAVALHADAMQRHVARPLPAVPAPLVDTISPTDALMILNRIEAPTVPVQNAIKRLTTQTNPPQ
jgi:hypothetical protein